MPLKHGGKKAVQANIAELYHANESKPAGKKRERDQIIAIAFAAAKRKKAFLSHGHPTINPGRPSETLIKRPELTRLH